VVGVFKSVAGKLIFRMVIGAIVALIIGLLAVLQFKQQMLNENAITLLKAKDSLLQQSFHEKMNTGSASLFSALAIMPELSELFVNKDHAALRVYLGNLPKVFKQETEFKNIRLNAFDADGNILMRTAATEPDSERGKSALHRSGFKKVLSGEVSHFEGLDFSRAGVSLVSVVSVKNKAGKVVGLLEFQSGFGSVVDTMVNQHAIYMVQLLNQEVLELYTKGKENPQLGGYYLAHPMQYETSRTWYQSLDIEQVMRQGFSIQNDKAVTLSPMISSDGKQIGYRLVGMDLAHPELQLIAHNIDVVIESMMLLLVVMLAILMVLLTGLVNRIVTKPLQHVGEGLSKVSQTGKLNLTIDYHADDEVGSMVSDLERVFNQVASALLEANQVVSAVAHGDFSRRVETALIGDLAELKSGVNASAEKVSFMMDELSKVMQGLAQGNFAVTMDERVAPAFREQVDAAMKYLFLL
jgi:methyl-accepting chemotaxis protein